MNCRWQPVATMLGCSREGSLAQNSVTGTPARTKAFVYKQDLNQLPMDEGDSTEHWLRVEVQADGIDSCKDPSENLVENCLRLLSATESNPGHSLATSNPKTIPPSSLKTIGSIRVASMRAAGLRLSAGSSSGTCGFVPCAKSEEDHKDNGEVTMEPLSGVKDISGKKWSAYETPPTLRSCSNREFPFSTNSLHSVWTNGNRPKEDLLNIDTEYRTLAGSGSTGLALVETPARESSEKGEPDEKSQSRVRKLFFGSELACSGKEENSGVAQRAASGSIEEGKTVEIASLHATGATSNVGERFLDRLSPSVSELFSTNSDLCYLNSPEPGEESQAEALSMVDKLVWLNSSALPQDPLVDEEYFPTSSSCMNAKGAPQSLIKVAEAKAGLRDPMGVFDWVDNQHDEQPMPFPGCGGRVKETSRTKKQPPKLGSWKSFNFGLKKGPLEVIDGTKRLENTPAKDKVSSVNNLIYPASDTLCGVYKSEADKHQSGAETTVQDTMDNIQNLDNINALISKEPLQGIQEVLLENQWIDPERVQKSTGAFVTAQDVCKSITNNGPGEISDEKLECVKVDLGPIERIQDLNQLPQIDSPAEQQEIIVQSENPDHLTFSVSDATIERSKRKHVSWAVDLNKPNENDPGKFKRKFQLTDAAIARLLLVTDGIGQNEAEEDEDEEEDEYEQDEAEDAEDGNDEVDQSTFGNVQHLNPEAGIEVEESPIFKSMGKGLRSLRRRLDPLDIPCKRHMRTISDVSSSSPDENPLSRYLQIPAVCSQRGKLRSSTAIDTSAVEQVEARTPKADVMVVGGVRNKGGIGSARKRKEPDKIAAGPCASPVSSLDTSPMETKRRRIPGAVHVLFSHGLAEETSKQQRKILAKLGGKVARSASECTHFVANKFVRTGNMLEAMAAGKPVVTFLWLEHCGHVKGFVDEQKFILEDINKEKELGFSMCLTLNGAQQKPLFLGIRVYITPYTSPAPESLACIVKAAGGQVVNEYVGPSFDEEGTEFCVVISTEDELDECIPLLEQGAKVYSSELILSGVVCHYLDFSKHQLFKHVKIRRRRPFASRRISV